MTSYVPHNLSNDGFLSTSVQNQVYQTVNRQQAINPAANNIHLHYTYVWRSELLLRSNLAVHTRTASLKKTKRCGLKLSTHLSQHISQNYFELKKKKMLIILGELKNYSPFNWTVHKYWSKGDITNQFNKLWNLLCISNSIRDVNYVFVPFLSLRPSVPNNTVLHCSTYAILAPYSTWLF